MVLLHRPLVAEPGQDGTAAHNPGASPMRDPRHFVVIQNARPIFTVYRLWAIKQQSK
jgi:hypothetical protein